MSGTAETIPSRKTSVAASPNGKLVQGPQKHVVHWFRKGLRLHDNPSLRESVIGAATFRCVFIIDPWFASSSNVGINKWRFLLQCLDDLDKTLRKLNSRLFVVRGQPAEALPKLFKEWKITTLSFEEDPEPYGRIRDHNITSKCREVGITVMSRVSHTLYKLDKIIEQNGGKAPLTYHQFQALIANMPIPLPAEEAISMKLLNGTITPIADNHDDRFGVPTLEELGFDTEGLKPAIWMGGETEALVRLERHLERKAWVASFGRLKMTPQSLLANQTGLSPYLRFGCLSPRLFYYHLTDLYKRVKKAQPPLSLHGQLLWREFFYCAATRNPNFDRMEGNPLCVQIPWEKNVEALAKWANGQTGFPWIDAIMSQLKEEGWIHHLARHAVACFLTRGDLWISWEEGMKVFDELLLDADWSVNAGMWMWWSCSSFFQQFFHCYCPVQFGRKADPNGDFIRRYIPVLNNMPTRYIHEPWVAPLSVQQSARCVIGQNYPMPMVDHKRVSQINIERIKQVFAQLATYKPQVLNVQNNRAPQPHIPPASIVANMNQPNYLCNQTVSLPTTSHQISTATSSRNNINEQNKDQKPIPIKQIIIVPQAYHSNSTQKSITYIDPYMKPPKQPEFIALTKTTSAVEEKTSTNSYNFKNLAINNYSATYMANNLLQSPVHLGHTPYLSHQQAIMLNYYTNTEKAMSSPRSIENTLQMPINDIGNENSTANNMTSKKDISTDTLSLKVNKDYSDSNYSDSNHTEKSYVVKKDEQIITPKERIENTQENVKINNVLVAQDENK